MGCGVWGVVSEREWGEYSPASRIHLCNVCNECVIFIFRFHVEARNYNSPANISPYWGQKMVDYLEEHQNSISIPVTSSGMDGCRMLQPKI